MARHKENKTKKIICLNCSTSFIIPQHKKRQFCSVSCSQIYTKSKNKEWLNKRDITNMNKYGVKSPLESQLVQEKYKNSILEKYGVSNPFLSKKIKNKAKQSILKKYGTDVATKNKTISKKISDKLKNRIPNRDTKMDIRWEKIQTYCGVENLTPLFNKQYLQDNLIKDIRVKFKCNKCDSINEVNIANGYLPTCNKCSNYKGYSIIEEEITAFIQSNYKGNIQLKNRSILSSNREIDIYLPDLSLAIEINGLYWHSEIWGKYRNYHVSKTEECLGKNIALFHIFDHEWLYKQEIIKSMLLNKLGLIKNKIYARKCNIKEISTNDKNLFLNNNHIQGQCISKTNLGLYYKDELVSVMTFGKNRFKQDNSTELIRFCNKTNINVVGAFSKLMSYYIKHYHPSSIVTFADRRYSLGEVYKKTGFVFSKYTSPSYFYWKNMKIYNRINFQKHKLSKILDKFNNKLSEYDNMLNNGYNRVWDCGNYKFIYQVN